MAAKRKLLDRVEKLLDSLITEAQTTVPAVFDGDGIEKAPARFSATFGERLKLAEVITNFESRRAKMADDDPPPSELDKIMEDFQENANRAVARGSSRAKTRAPESNGIANAGRALPEYDRGPGVGGSANLG
jgi:hypothetical protein